MQTTAHRRRPLSGPGRPIRPGTRDAVAAVIVVAASVARLVLPADLDGLQMVRHASLFERSGDMG